MSQAVKRTVYGINEEVRDLLAVAFIAALLASYYFSGPTGKADVAMHLSRVRIIMDCFPKVPRWNPYWYFGVPFLRTYSGLFHYSLAGLCLFLSDIFPALPKNEIISLAVKVYTPLIFALGAASIYFLAREIGLPRSGSIFSSILLVTSYNIYGYWAIGSYPNISSLMISPLPLALYIRSLKWRDPKYAVLAGLTFGIVALTYLSNAIYLIIFFAILSALMAMRMPELLYIARRIDRPPEYTLTLLKFALLTAASALATAAWWLIPFYTSVTASRSIVSARAHRLIAPTIIRPSLIEQLMWISGISGFTIKTPGICHFALVLLSLFFLIRLWRTAEADGVYMAIAALLLCFLPCLGYRMTFLPIKRAALFLSLFGSLAGGFAISVLLRIYDLILEKKTGDRRGRTYRLILLVPTLSCILASIFTPLIIFIKPFEASPIPPWNWNLERKVRLGERIGLDGGYGLNLVSNVWQSGGGSVESMYILNEFAYTFWYYIIYSRENACLPYFSRNYNIRYIRGVMLEGLKRTDLRGLYEVSGFNSSIVEVIPKGSWLILHIGPADRYIQLFISTALSGEAEPILVNGGRYLEEFSAEELGRFDLIYISDMNLRDEDRFFHLITSYLKGGGVVLFDISRIPPMLSENLMDILPAKRISKEKSNLRFALSQLLKKTGTFKFRGINETIIAYAEELNAEAEAIAWNENGKPVIVMLQKHGGYVFWSGISIPYLVMLSNDHEGARLLINLMHLFTFQIRGTAHSGTIRHGNLKMISTDEYEIALSSLSPEDAVWFKMTYYPGWEAIIEDVGEKVRIFPAGPNMMLIFPGRKGPLRIIFRFGKTIDVILGEIISASFYIILPICIMLGEKRRKKIIQKLKRLLKIKVPAKTPMRACSA